MFILDYLIALEITIPTVVFMSILVQIRIWIVNLEVVKLIVGADLVESIDKRSIFGLGCSTNR